LREKQNGNKHLFEGNGYKLEVSSRAAYVEINCKEAERPRKGRNLECLSGGDVQSNETLPNTDGVIGIVSSTRDYLGSGHVKANPPATRLRVSGRRRAGCMIELAISVNKSIHGVE